jgi:threonine dehydratase
MIIPNEKHDELAKILGIEKLFFKREDMHPYGSHKGRSIPVMIDTYISQGSNHFAISSSGNAALAGAIYINKLNLEKDKKENSQIKLDILVGQHISTKKLEKLNKYKDENINITMHDRPLQTLFEKTKDTNIKALRQSNDDLALLGYDKLAEELLEIPDLKAIFIGTSSGTTAQALAEYFDKLNKKIEIHIVQTSSCHPIADPYIDISNEIIEEISIADAIVDHTALRKNKLTHLITQSAGNAWIASNEQIKSAQNITKEHTGLQISTNSALSVSGLMQAIYTGKIWDGSVVCMICGE